MFLQKTTKSEPFLKSHHFHILRNFQILLWKSETSLDLKIYIKFFQIYEMWNFLEIHQVFSTSYLNKPLPWFNKSV